MGRRSILLRREELHGGIPAVFTSQGQIARDLFCCFLLRDALVIGGTQNYRLKLKNEDYKNQDPETALRVSEVTQGGE